MASYSQGMAYELAREMINAQIAALNTAVGVEERKVAPVAAHIEKLEAQMIEFARQREELNPADDAAVSAIIQRYRKPPVTADLPALRAAG